ncbi:MAG: Fur family transcriptional regulator [Gammaproteobacteria bacterium]
MTIFDILQNAKVKPLAGRVAVVEALANGECLSAQDIIARQSGGERPGAATIYRALSALCVAGVVKRIPTDTSALYMLVHETAAAQLICSRCGKVEEIHSPELAKYNAALMKNRGVEESSLLMVADCKRKECDS